MPLPGLSPARFRIGHPLAWSLLWTAVFCSCSPVRALEPSRVSQSAAFLEIGATTTKEIEGRLGSQYTSFEDGRIKIYHVSFDDRERLTLKQGWPCYALVLVFDGEGVLRRDALIKNGCGIREP